MPQWLSDFWDALGVAKFGVAGSFLRILVDPPDTRVGAVRVFLIGFFFSGGGVLAAELWHPAAAPFVAFAAGFLGDEVAKKVLQWIRNSTPEDWLNAVTRRGNRRDPE
jgi:CHASE2 domain-containing sensor protein